MKSLLWGVVLAVALAPIACGSADEDAASDDAGGAAGSAGAPESAGAPASGDDANLPSDDAGDDANLPSDDESAGAGGEGGASGDDAGGEAGAAGTTAANGGAAGAPTVVATQPTFQSIYTNILSTSCVSQCHEPTHNYGNLNLKDDGLTALVNVAAKGSKCANKSLVRVVPGQSSKSLMLGKVSGTPPCGKTMPPPPKHALSAAQITVIQQWIDAGAPP